MDWYFGFAYSMVMRIDHGISESLFPSVRDDKEKDGPFTAGDPGRNDDGYDERDESKNDEGDEPLVGDIGQNHGGDNEDKDEEEEEEQEADEEEQEEAEENEDEVEEQQVRNIFQKKKHIKKVTMTGKMSNYYKKLILRILKFARGLELAIRSDEALDYDKEEEPDRPVRCFNINPNLSSHSNKRLAVNQA
jgi:cobalamin biosynthesis protein CobT